MYGSLRIKQNALLASDTNHDSICILSTNGCPDTGELSPSGDRAKSRVNENAGNCLALISLNLDQSILNRWTSTADILHLLRGHFLLSLVNADTHCGQCESCSSSVRSLPNDIHTSTIVL